MIKISVVIPTYHRPQLLYKCLSALTNQNFSAEEYEVLIVHDGPDEITRFLIPDLLPIDKRFIFLQTSIKKGPAAARNFGWQNAKGILVAFTDDDTLPDKNWFHSIWQAYNNEKEIAFTGKTVVPISHD